MADLVVCVPFLSHDKQLYKFGDSITLDAKTAKALIKKGFVMEAVDEVPADAVVLEEVKAEDIAEVVEEAVELPEVDAAASVTNGNKGGDKGKAGKGNGGKNKK